MDKKQIKQKVLKFKWEKWLERPFNAFTMSTFAIGMTRPHMKRTGVDGEYQYFLFEDKFWYRSIPSEESYLKALRKYFKTGGSMKMISHNLEEFYKNSKRELKQLNKSSLPINKKMKVVADILGSATSFLWIAHGVEVIFMKELYREVPKYFSGDVEKFIGDISYPKKKGAHTKFEEALLSGKPLEKIHKRFGWIKMRDCFHPAFTITELEDLQKNLRMNYQKKKVKRPFVPTPIKKLISEVQELVYFRTKRTDVLYELYYCARPILTEFAQSLGLTFLELQDYDIRDLLKGKIIKYPQPIFCACYRSQILFSPRSILLKEKQIYKDIKGVVAFKGKVRGRVVIVTDPSELNKVKLGDILVAQMTFPSFISAMHKAVAFVTDEGGITCHAAIVAREMRKPCITGTRIATKVLKDGDIVEVDANIGVVKKI